MASPARELATDFLGNDLDNPRPSISAAAPSKHRTPTALQVLELRAWSKGYLARFGLIDFLDAVDELHDSAVWSGLIDELGQDAVQKVMRRGFEAANG